MKVEKLIEMLKNVDPNLEVYVTMAPDNQLEILEEMLVGTVKITEDDCYDGAPYKEGDSILALGMYPHNRDAQDLPDVYHPRIEPIEERRYPLAEKLMQALYRKEDMSDEDWENFDLQFMKDNKLSYKKIQNEIDIQIAKGSTFEEIVTLNKKYQEEYNEDDGLTSREKKFKNSRSY